MKMPKEGRFVSGEADPVSGQRWIHVTREMALGHPQGRLSLPLYVLLLGMATSAALRLAIFASGGGAWYVLEFLVMLLAVVALFLRAPPGLWLGVIACALVMVDFATGPMGPWQLGEAVAAVVAGFYLLTGARPNLIYRHRYLADEPEGEDGHV